MGKLELLYVWRLDYKLHELRGGAVTVYPGGSAYLIAGEISGNHNIGYGQGYGGGVYVHTGTAEIGSGMKICNNTADDGGDDIFSDHGTITVEQSGLRHDAELHRKGHHRLV